MVLHNKLSSLHRALIQFMLDVHLSNGYKEIYVPYLVNSKSLFGTSQLPKFYKDLFKIENHDLWLIPTSEVPVTNVISDQIIDIDNLPMKFVCHSACFRSEAGSYGKDVRGLNRLHQFDKVEIVQIERPENSYDILNEMVEHVSSILDELELPYRILKLCGDDLSFTSALTFDFEVYSAGQKKWLEVSSVSNFEDYQSNRLKLRYKDSNGKNQLCHTLNGSALALPRIYAALIENNQTPDSIIIPKALQAYTGFDIIK